MSPGCHPKSECYDYNEYDENILFEEFVERAEENFEDPELEVIKSLLEKKGFKINVEHSDRWVVTNKLTGAKTLKTTADITLVNGLSDEIVMALLQRTLSAPMLTSERIRQDDEFLKEARIRW